MDELISHIKNYYRADNKIGTAGQPAEDQFKSIRSDGYEVVINLTPKSVPGALPGEEEIVRHNGMDYFHLPVAWDHPREQDVLQFFSLLEQNKSRKIFIHCILNLRVSAFLFLYRVKRLGWTVDSARPDLERFWTPNDTWKGFMERMLSNRYDILCVGNYTRDTIITPVEKKVVDGGAMNYAAHAAAAMGLRAAVVTRLSRQDGHVLDELQQAGVDCYPTYTAASTNLVLEYPTTNPDIRTIRVESEAGAFSPDQMDGLRARAVVIGASFRGEVNLDFLHHVRVHFTGRLAVDAQGFLRVVEEGTLKPAAWDEMEEVLSCIDVFKVDAVEAQVLTGTTDILKAAQQLTVLGPAEIVLTHRDGLLILAEGEAHQFSWRARKLDGRSGRGDTCLGTYTSCRLSAPPHESGRWAAALTSLKMEVNGPFMGTISEVEQLLAEQYT